MLRRLLEASIRHSGREASQNGESSLPLHRARGLSSRSGNGKRPLDNRRSKGGDASIRQQRLASEVRAVVTTGLQQGACNAPLLQRCGFEIEEVKMSGDLRKAFVLWKAMPGMQQTVEKELNAQGKRLRSMVFEHLTMPFSPSIEFCQVKPNSHAQAVEEALRKLEESN